MAIKNLRFSFDVPIVDLLSLVATRNDALHIDVIGDGREPKQPKKLRNGAAAIAGLIEGPGRQGRHGQQKIGGKDEAGHPITGYQLIAKTVMTAPDHTVTISGLGAVLDAHSLNRKSVSPQVSGMARDGDLKRVGQGTYKVTPQGARNFIKLLKERDAKIAAHSVQEAQP